MAYSRIMVSNWREYLKYVDKDDEKEGAEPSVVISGTSLSLASIVAVARIGGTVALSDECACIIKKNADDLAAKLQAGGTVYAVNTGIGGSADVRTDAVEDLQQAIVKTLTCGIALDTPDDEDPDTLPQDWTRAAQLVRTNTLAAANSGVRLQLVQTLIKLLQHEIIPKTPLRGSISASGDLIPLTYLAGLVQGNPGIKAYVLVDGVHQLVAADEALKMHNIQPLTYAPKEALALANGTSVSAGAAALAINDAHDCMSLAQVLIAMAVEALNGTDESFDPYISHIRPHPGQQEVAANVRYFLRGSKLTRKEDTANVGGLRQDRYSLRTAPQWMGPEIENMILAHNQIVTECNSITDNPIIRKDGHVLQGGNFQASSVTSAMDKTRAALSTVGRMLFQQTTELMMPSMNNGLPPNLTADEPSCDFLLKGVDIASASYQSELAFISHSVTPFVMVAEQANQSLNSLALVSTRYTHEALKIFMRLCANSLLVTCQALDLRVIQHQFEELFEPIFEMHFPIRDGNCSELAGIKTNLWTQFLTEMRQRSTLDFEPRAKASMATVFAGAITHITEMAGFAPSSTEITSLSEWADDMVVLASDYHKISHDNHTVDKTLAMLGNGSKKLYKYIRVTLAIPFLRKGELGPQRIPTFENCKLGTTVGSLVSSIYEDMRNGSLFFEPIECVSEAIDDAEAEQKIARRNR